MTDRKNTETLTERMALLAWHVAALDEDAAPMLFASIRKDDHEAIAQLIRSDHVLTDDDEVEAAIASVLAGEDAI